MTEQSPTYLAERPHALYSPSRLPNLEACPGWLSDGAPGPLAERGTRIGELLAQCMVHWTDTFDAVDPDHRDAFAYGLAVLASIREIWPDLDWKSEPYVETGIRDCAGYLDLLSVDELLGEAVLIEIKTGRSERAPAQDNRQVQAYTLGVFHDYPTVYEVHAYLIECDRETTTAATFTRAECVRLKSTCMEIILNAKDVTDDSLCPGTYCRWCARREQCPRMVESPEMALAVIGDRSALSPKDYAEALSPGALGETLARVAPLADLVEIYVGALKARTMQIIEAGGEVPGWDVKTSNGVRSWADEEGALVALRDGMMDLDAVKTLVSPAQVEKRLGKEAGRLIAPYITQGKRRGLVQVPIIEDY